MHRAEPPEGGAKIGTQMIEHRMEAVGAKARGGNAEHEGGGVDEIGS